MTCSNAPAARSPGALCHALRSGRPAFSLLLAAALACAGCTSGPDTDAATAPAPIAVRVAAARRGAIRSVLTASGETDALRTLQLASPVAGRVTGLGVQVGDSIDANAVVAHILPTENGAAIRGLELLRAAGALRPGEQAIAQRQTHELSGREIPLSIPFAAVVAQRLHSSGELVAANEALVDVFDPRSLVAIAQVPADALGSIAVGQRVSIRAFAARTSGTVAAVGGSVAAQSVTVPVRVALDGALTPPLLHAPVECEIVLGEHDRALLIPLSALLAAGGKKQGVVMVAEGDRARRRTLRLGWRDAETVEVAEGLHEGDQVLIDGGLALPDGTAIMPQPEPHA